MYIYRFDFVIEGRDGRVVVTLPFSSKATFEDLAFEHVENIAFAKACIESGVNSDTHLILKRHGEANSFGAF